MIKQAFRTSGGKISWYVILRYSMLEQNLF